MKLPQPLALRPFRPADDAPVLRSWVAGPLDLMTWAGPHFTWPLDDAQLAAYAAEPGRRTWTAVSPDGTPDGTPLGHISLADGRLGRVLIAPEARGRGLGESLVSLTVSLGFDELALPEIALGVWTHNTAALRIYEKLGFRTTETLEAVETVDGEPWSVHRMRLTASDRRQ
ncbi:GNAT family N-acetyltransferase [Streptomyces erythrochromogenes]|uniref:GNAT family N-acetyltransferase n=1 Tax=Streptomyces erythrochromogenes TaxID=285574 RepID=UPI003867E972|nr:GNAT family N-acetyltransferase [Streptomyces erythrochromogenes]